MGEMQDKPPAVAIFEALYQDCEEEGHINLRFLPSKKNIFIPLPQINNIPSVLASHRDQNCYFGVATRSNGNGTAQGIMQVPALWLDLDTPANDAGKKFKEFPLPPTFSLETSTEKYQVFWVLREPVGKEEIPHVEDLLRRLAVYFSGDMAATDASRILRVPGTLNMKYDPHPQVKVLGFTPDKRYELSDFEDLLPEVPREERISAPDWQEGLLPGVEKGERNNAAAKLAGRYLTKGLTPQECFYLLRSWNQANRPPLADGELRSVIESVSKTHARNHPRRAVRETSGEPKKEKLEDPLLNVYSGWAGEFSKVYSEHTEAPRSFYFMSALTCLGILLSGRVTLASAVSPQTRLFTLILGESADDRKSTAIKLTVDFFQEAIEDFPICHGVGSAEGMAEKFKEKGSKLLLVHDEFRSFVSKSKIEGSVLLSTTNTLFESNCYQSATKKHSINLGDVHLAILGASTVETYANMFDPVFLDIGFLNRLFVVKDHGSRRFHIPPKIGEEEKKALTRSLGALLEVVKEASENGAFEIGIIPEAEAIFKDWYMNLPKTQTAKRLDTYGLRLLPLLAVNNDKIRIDRETAQRVITLLNYELQVRTETDPIDADNKIAVMEERIRRVLRRGPRRSRDLRKSVHYERDGIFIFTTALKNLAQTREVKFDRTADVYLLEEGN